MAIDIRATVTCSLGTLISGSISDDYLQGSGLIKTRGSVEISGTITPAIGTAVTFSYTKNGVARSIPRKLRVMSSFADPFRRTTKVELGCKLTYMGDVRESLTWDAFNDPENRDIPREDAEIVTLPIYASSVMAQCLAKLGLAASGGALTNAFSVEKFDFSPGYVQVLSDLLISENYFGYLDTNEVLQIRSLNAYGGTGPVFTSADIVDLGPIGVGQLPGEAVTVSYSTLILKVPEEDEEDPETPGGIPSSTTTPPSPEEAAAQAIINEKRNWERQETYGSVEEYYIPYTVDGATTQSLAIFTGTTSTISETKYKTIRFNKLPRATFPVDNEELTLIGDINQLPVYTSIGNTSVLTPEQAAEFEIDPTSVLEEVWPDAELYEYVSDGSDKWVYLSGGWTLNPPTYQQQYETDPIAVLNEIWPSPQIYDYVADGDDKWIHTGSGNWYHEKKALDPDELYEEKEVPVLRTSLEYGPLVAIAASAATDRLTYGYGFNNQEVLISETIETFQYDKYGNETGTEVLKYENKIKIAAASDLRWADADSAINLSYSGLSGTTLTEQIVTTNELESGYTRDTTSSYVKYVFTQNGQQALANAVQQAESIAQMVNIIDWIMASGLVHNKTTTSVNKTGTTTSQERPPAAVRANSSYSKGTLTEEEKETKPENLATSGDNNEATPDPNNGYRVESSGELELAVGSATAERRIELSMPYAPDDRFVKSANSKYYSIKSDAKSKAAAFGRTQNRLLLGNRNGMNLQLSPERIPTAPFDPLYVQASGLTAIYRANGTSWAFDSNGIVASIDALFWAAVGGTGTFWFPVAPGITTLPAEPPIVDGQMNANTVVLPYNETALYDSRIRLLTTVTKFAYSLELLTVVPATVIRAFTEAVKVTPIHMPAPAAFTLAAAAPRIEPSTDVRVITTTTVTVTTNVPQVGSGIGLVIAPPATNIALAAPAPAFAVGSAVSVLLHMDGTNGSTTFTDSSLNALTVTGSGNAQISTAQSKFGGASALFDGTGDYLSTANTSLLEFGGNDFTVEMWINTTQNRQYATLISRGNATFTGGAWTLLINNSSATAGDVAVYCAAYSTSAALLTTTGANIRDGAWHHIAWVRSGTNHYIFVDGTQRASRTGTSFTIPTLTATTYIGYDANFTPRDFSGYIDDLRVTNGVAWYTANFTAPTAAFPNP